MPNGRRDVLQLNQEDNVVVALHTLQSGGEYDLGGTPSLLIREAIPVGHKVAIRKIPAGSMVIKYGEEIGEATTDIEPGDHVHIHNVRDITAEVSARERKEFGL